LTPVSEVLSESGSLEEVKRKTFPRFELGPILKKLPDQVHLAVFRVVAVFGGKMVTAEQILDYLRSAEPSGWEAAIGCLDLSESLDIFVDPIVAASKLELTDNDLLSRSLSYLDFILQTRELRDCVFEDAEAVEALAAALQTLFAFLLLRLDVQFPHMESFSEMQREFASSIPDEAHIIVARLVVTIRAQLAIRSMPAGDASDFFAANSSLASGFFAPTVAGIIGRYSEEALTPPNLPFLVLAEFYRVFADMMALHAFGPDDFFGVLEVFANGLFTDLGCGEPLKVVTYTCLHKIVLGIALDTTADENEHHAGRLLKRMVENATSLETQQTTLALVSDLVQHEMRNRNMPWLVESLAKLCPEGDEGGGGDAAGLREFVTDAIQKICKS
jgi:hypothetical protein